MVPTHIDVTTGHKLNFGSIEEELKNCLKKSYNYTTL